ncbi:MAG: L-threonylcarbamoyladenylate synthase [Phycisphaerales bacterium]
MTTPVPPVASVNSLPADDQSILLAAQWLRQGRLVAFPTETVYGLGASCTDESALARLYALKGRPGDNPLIAHVATPGEVGLVACPTPRQAGMLADLGRRFWPGPLTMVLPRGPGMSPSATGGRDTVAVRCPAHPVARALLTAFGAPIAAPSANRSGHISPTSAAHVLADFANASELLVIDGGPSRVGVESTVVDLVADPPRLLRPGSVLPEQLVEALGEIDTTPMSAQGASPGTAARHYSPRTPALLLDLAGLRQALAERREPCAVVATSDLDVPRPHGRMSMPKDAEAYAARLYAVLREVDQAGFSAILIERPPSRAGLWSTILDRLERATTTA